MKRILAAIFVVGLAACTASYPSLSQINQYESEDQKTLFGMLATLQQSLNERDVDGWFALYTDDAIITYTENRPTSKQAVMDDVRSQDPRTWNFKIVDIMIVSTEIHANTATVQTVLVMKTGSRARRHPETYYFEKMDGRWLIAKETNP